MIRHDVKWSNSEKKVARMAFEAALDTALSGVMSEFRARAAAVTTPAEMWNIEDFLRRRHREVEELFDYRYSQLPFVFARLICLGYLSEAQLAGLSDEKMAMIRNDVAWMNKRQPA